MSIASFPSVDSAVFPPSLGSTFGLSNGMREKHSFRGLDDDLAEEHRIAQSHARQYLLPVFDPPVDAPSPVDPSVSDLLCGRFCKEHKLVPIATEGDYIDIAVTSPESLLLSEMIQAKTGRHMRPMFSPLNVVERLLSTLYPDLNTDDDSLETSQPIDSSEFKPVIDNTPAATKPVGTRPNRYLSDMLNSAIRSGVSSLYFDVVNASPRVRWRVNGQLEDHAAPTTIELYDAMIAQIKSLAKIDNQEPRFSMSGAFNLRRDGLCVNAIANVLRTQSGEQVILKLRESLAQPLDLSSIGLSIPQQRELQSALQHPHGLYLFVGTSRSGRTTTQYACLDGIKMPSSIRCTIETRVSQVVMGALQLSMHDDPQRDWSDTFDACAEYDPDVSLVELMDDRDLATRCALAAASNQRVLASVRATTPLQAIGQLRQLGVDNGIIADSLRCVVAQRLVRRLCEQCREEETMGREVAIAFHVPVNSTVYQARGCEHCHGSGYVGNTGVFEVLSIHPRLRDAIAMNASAGEIAKVVRSSEIVTLDGAMIEKLLVGETSISEATRVGLLRI